MPFHVWPVYDHREIEAVTGVIESRNWWRYSHGESSGLNQTAAEAESHVGRFQTASPSTTAVDTGSPQRTEPTRSTLS